MFFVGVILEWVLVECFLLISCGKESFFYHYVRGATWIFLYLELFVKHFGDCTTKVEECAAGSDDELG